MKRRGTTPASGGSSGWPADARELAPGAALPRPPGRLAPPHGEAWLLLPETYMNHSGRAVAALASYLQDRAATSVLIVHDELDLPPGTVRLKKGGGTGGHNGVSDVAAHLGSKGLLATAHRHRSSRRARRGARLRAVSAARRRSAALIEDAIERSLELWPLIAEAKMEAAMLKLHTKKPTE